MSEHKTEFEIAPETLVESGLYLAENGSGYETHLAYEMLLALEDSNVDGVRYEDLSGEIYNE